MRRDLLIYAAYQDTLNALGDTVDDLKAPLVQNVVDFATIGTDDKVTNAALAGSPATGWTLSNFASNSPGITHTAGTVGSASTSVTLAAYLQYQVSITLSTTTAGGIGINVNGTSIFDTGVVMTFPVQGSTTYTFAWITATTGAQAIEVFTDTAWAGQITTINLFEVAAIMPLTYTAVPTDDANLRIPYGFKWGRYNAGTFVIGDKLTGALLSADATWNVIIGARAAWSMVDAFECTLVGTFAGQNNQADRLVAYGYGAAKNNISGTQITAGGYKCFGTSSTGKDLCGWGFHVGLQVTTGSYLCGFGTQSLYNATTDTYHTAGGHQSGLSWRGGIANTAWGALAGRLHGSNTYSYSYGTMIGAETKVFGERGTTLGHLATVGADGAPVDNGMALGANARTRIANSTKIGSGQASCGVSGKVYSRQPLCSANDGVGKTYSVTEFVGSKVLSRSGPGSNFSDTTPTAAQIVAAIPGCEPEMGYDLHIRNTSGFTLTLLAGSGVTLSGTTTVATVQTRHYVIQVTNIGSGTEAVTVVGVSTAAN